MLTNLKKQIAQKLQYVTNSQSLLYKASRFAVCECLEGDYYEFGVYRGASFIDAYHNFEYNFNQRINLHTGGDDEAESKALRNKLWQNMNYVAFDSFEGLPPIEDLDKEGEDFKKGMYSCSEQSFLDNLKNSGVDTKKVKTIPGWYSNTCTLDTLEKYNLRKASVIWIDCDLYSSTKEVLQLVTHLIQDGTVLIFDDWFSFKGSPFRGEQKAFSEWISSPEIKNKFVFNEYQKEDWKRISFICSQIPEK